MINSVCFSLIFMSFILFWGADSCNYEYHMRAVMKAHSICRGGLYPRSQVQRFEVPDDKVPWKVDFPEYKPPLYSSLTLEGKSYADPKLGTSGFTPKWNSLDGDVNRASYEGAYSFDAEGYPLNPRGRTGLRGHGLLGRWGPNHAADPIVTRWKRNKEGEIMNNSTSNKPILQVVVVQRRDNKKWALPGGMVDPGEKVSTTAVREFLEEATNSLHMTDDEKLMADLSLKDFFSKGEEVLCTYVDDPRNTDNSWMETTAFSFHDESGDTLKYVALNAGDDAVGVKWIDLNREMSLYATHRDFVEKVAHVKHCHW